MIEKSKQTKKTRGSNLKRVPWQRLALSIFGILIILLDWRWAVYHLYTLPEHSITSFTSITNNAFYVIGALVVFFVTGRLIYEWKNQTTTELIDQAEHISENVLHKSEETKTINYNEHIIEEGTNGAPANKPFAQLAIHEDGYDDGNSY